jgi:hypothetical protein
MRTFAFALAIASANAFYSYVADGPEWEAKSAAEKRDYIWNQVTYDSESGRYHYLKIMTEDMNLSFDATGDEMPCTFNVSDKVPTSCR